MTTAASACGARPAWPAAGSSAGGSPAAAGASRCPTRAVPDTGGLRRCPSWMRRRPRDRGGRRAPGYARLRGDRAHVRRRPARPPAPGATTCPGDTVGDVLGAARQRYGGQFADVLPTCRIWVNGDPAAGPDNGRAGDEVAVLPPVSGGAGERADRRPASPWTSCRPAGGAAGPRRRRVLRRRVAQGRADLARAELARRTAGTPRLSDDLAPRARRPAARGRTARPGRPTTSASTPPVELDQLCADHGFGRLDELDDGAVAELAAALDAFEGGVGRAPPGVRRARRPDRGARPPLPRAARGPTTVSDERPAQ